MATIADTLVTTLDTNYGGIGGGGAKPTIFNLGDKKATPPERDSIDWVGVLLPRGKDIDLLSDEFVYNKYVFTVKVQTTHSDTRLMEIVDEIRRIIATNGVSTCDLAWVRHEEETTDRRVPLFRYELTVLLEQDMFAQAAGYSGSGAGDQWADIYFLVSQASDLLDNEVLIGAISDGVHIKPATDDGIDIGDTSHRIGKGWLNDADIDGTLTGAIANFSGLVTANAGLTVTSGQTLTLSGATVTGLTDAGVPNDITLTNITQITTRPHSSLTGIGAGDHHAKYTDGEARSAAVDDTVYSGDWNGVDTIAPSKNAAYDKINAMISDTAYAGSWDGVTDVAPSKNAVYDRMSLLALDAEVTRNAIPLPVINLALGTDQTTAGRAELTLVRYPAADDDCLANFVFSVPQDVPSGKTWYLRTVWLSTTADSYHFHWYVSIYNDGTAYTGWNEENNTNANGEAGDNVVTDVANERCEEIWTTGWTISAGDVVTVQLRKQSDDDYDLYLISIELYWA